MIRAAVIFAAAALVGGCGSSDGLARPDGGGLIDAAHPPAPDLGASADLASPMDGGAADVAMLEPVSHTRELRAVWVATVSRLDFPSSTTLSATAARAELSSIVDVAEAAGMNAIFFQVRPESDALYQSSIEPWSRFLTGTQGVDPGYDPLALLLELAHAKGLEVHAWMNPYRGLVTPGVATAPNHITNLYPESAITYNNAVVMNPADTRVRDHVVAVITDVTHRYDVDGVLFDDYFYPYPDGSTQFPDDTSYQAYVDGGGVLSKSDWRRDNVNQLISRVAAAVRGEKPWVRWGVAPFGIYRPGMPSGVVGLDAYEVLACDSVYWMSQGWVDYLAPQIYWTSSSTGQPFGALIDWWAGIAQPNRPVLASIALYKLGSTMQWTPSEIETQVALTRAAPGAGQTWFRYAFLRDNVMGVSSSFARFYAAPARPPVVPAMAAATLDPPSVSIAGSQVTLGHAALATVRGFAVYSFDGSAFVFTQWVPVGSGPIALASGRYAISAIDRGGVESPGVSVVIP